MTPIINTPRPIRLTRAIDLTRARAAHPGAAANPGFEGGGVEEEDEAEMGEGGGKVERWGAEGGEKGEAMKSLPWIGNRRAGENDRTATG